MITLARAAAAGLMGLSVFTVVACERAPKVATPVATPSIEQGWARTTPTGAKTGAGYLVIVNGATPDRLLSVSSPAAEKVELHESAMEGMVMTMQPLDAQPLAAGETLTFAPGGKHLMFVGLKAPFAAGTAVPITLRFEKAGEQTVNLVVRDTPPEAPAP